MRRLLLAAAIGVAVLGAAGCSTGDTPATTAGPQVGVSSPGSASTGGVAPGRVVPGGAVPGASSPGGVAAAGKGPLPGQVAAKNARDAALSGNTAAICNQAAKTGSQFGAAAARDLKLLGDAGSAADRSGKVKQQVMMDVQNYSFALTQMSKLAEDPGLKRALAEMSKRVRALNGDVRKVDDAMLGQLRGTLNKVCGK